MKLDASPVQQIPLENIHEIVTLLDPPDITSLSQTSRFFYSAIYGGSDADQYIWRELFLKTFDDPRIRSVSSDVGVIVPRSAPQTVKYNFKQEYQARIYAARTLRSESNSEKLSCMQRKEVLRAIVSVIRTAAPFPYATKNGTWMEELVESLGSWSPWTWVPEDVESWESPDDEERALRSELHVYIGLVGPDVDSVSNKWDSDDSNSSEAEAGPSTGRVLRSSTRTSNVSRIVSMHPGLHSTSSKRPASVNFRTEARSFVYNLLNYTPANLYAPLAYLSDGTYQVDYKHMEQIMLDILWNVREDLPLIEQSPGESDDDFHRRCSPPLSLDSLRPYSAPGWKEQFEQKMESRRQTDEVLLSPLRDDRPDTEWEPWEDWAGVEGVWNRVFSFMDYRDLARYNVRY